MRNLANEQLKVKSYTGYSGSFTGWLIPYCDAGYAVTLLDLDYDYKSGTYYAIEGGNFNEQLRRLTHHKAGEENMSGREIREKIKAIAGNQGTAFFTAEVVKVDGSTCTVEYAGSKLTGVKMFSIGAEGEFLIKPATGSMVTVADLSGG